MEQEPRPRSRLLTPHPSRPGSIVAFVALPALLILLTLTSVPARLLPVRPFLRTAYASPESAIPESRSRRVVELVNLLGSGTPEERGRRLLALARETERCPAYAPYTVQRIVSGLADPHRRVRAATAFALGALGSHAIGVLPYLREAQGKGDAYMDHVLSEAMWWIEHGEAFSDGEKCEPLPIAGDE